MGTRRSIFIILSLIFVILCIVYACQKNTTLEMYTDAEIAFFASNVTIRVSITVSNPGDLKSVSVTRTHDAITDAASAQDFKDVSTPLIFTFKPITSSSGVLENFVGTHAFTIYYTTLGTATPTKYGDVKTATIDTGMISLSANGTPGQLVQVNLNGSASSSSNDISLDIQRSFVLIQNGTSSIFPLTTAVYLSPDTTSTNRVFVMTGTGSGITPGTLTPPVPAKTNGTVRNTFKNEFTNSVEFKKYGTAQPQKYLITDQTGTYYLNYNPSSTTGVFFSWSTLSGGYPFAQKLFTLTY